MARLKVQNQERILFTKFKIVLKELRESFVCLKIIYKARLYKTQIKIEAALKENDELISIFVKSVETAQKNL